MFELFNHLRPSVFLEKCVSVRYSQSETEVLVGWARPGHVFALKCSVCIKFQERICGMRNYIVEGSENLRILSVTDMHTRAVLLLQKEVGIAIVYH